MTMDNVNATANYTYSIGFRLNILYLVAFVELNDRHTTDYYHQEG